MNGKKLDLKFSKSAEKFLNKCENFLYKRIEKRIEFLRENPFTSDSKFIKGRNEKIFRIRIGDYRIFYVVFYEDNLLYVTDIRKRPKAYLKEDTEGYYGEIIFKKCCCCGKDILIKVLPDGKYSGGNYFSGEDDKEDALSWECDYCWNDLKI